MECNSTQIFHSWIGAILLVGCGFAVASSCLKKPVEDDQSVTIYIEVQEKPQLSDKQDLITEKKPNEKDELEMNESADLLSKAGWRYWESGV